MRAIRTVITLLLIVALAAFVGTEIYSRLYVDLTAPRLECDSDIIECSVNATDEDLLVGVRASDNKDGDITARIEVESISGLVSNDTAIIRYVVFDDAGNVGTLRRTIRYTDYEKPRITLDSPLVFALNEKITLSEMLGATDLIDGDISGRLRIASHTIQSGTEGTFEINVQATNRLGDSESVPLKLIVSDLYYANASRLTLSSYIIYMKSGETFDPLSIVESVKDADGNTVNVSELKISGIENADFSAPGAYHILYETSDGAYKTYVTVCVR